MVTLKQHALEAWTQEQEKRKQAERKKRKRKAKKIEEDVDDLLPKELTDYQFERNLEADDFNVTVSIKDGDGTLSFTYDDDDELVLIGNCPACQAETISKPIETAAELGEMLEAFEPGSSHNCAHKRG